VTRNWDCQRSGIPETFNSDVAVNSTGFVVNLQTSQQVLRTAQAILGSWQRYVGSLDQFNTGPEQRLCLRRMAEPDPFNLHLQLSKLGVNVCEVVVHENKLRVPFKVPLCCPGSILVKRAGEPAPIWWTPPTA